MVAGVCARPVISKVTDLDTGELRLVPIACGSTRQSRCPACAERAQRLRMQQCREGWHLDTEPEWQPGEDDPADDDRLEGDEHERRVRSTRRRQDVPDLPRVPVEDRTIGRVFTAPGRQDLPALDVPHPHPPVVRPGPRRRHPGQPGHLRLPAGRLGRGALPAAAGPVLAEPAPLRRLERPVLRRRRSRNAASPRTPLRHPRHHPPRACCARSPRPPTTRCGGPPIDTVVYDGRPAAGLGRRWQRLHRPGHRRAAADLG